MKSALICLLIALPCMADPAMVLRYVTPPEYREPEPSTKYMDPSVGFPHSDWAREALPIGNGRLGAMVFGDPLNERIQFNDITLWSGGANESGKYSVDDPGGFGTYQNFGDLFITMEGIEAYDNYSRQLDLATGIHTTTWSSNGATYVREVFCSHPGEAIIIRITSSTNEVKATVALRDGRDTIPAVDGNSLRFMGHLSNNLKYAAMLTVKNGGVRTKVLGEKLEVAGKTIELVLTAGTEYAMDPAKGFRREDHLGVLLLKQAAAAKQPHEDLRAAHIEDFSSLMNRVVLDIGEPPAGLDMTRRLERYRSGREDPHLEMLLFQFGRYLMASCSRHSLPANLQGLWNDMNHPAWFCDYHTNINIQMNYWPVEVANLSECHLPLFNWIEASIPGSRAATRRAFGEDTPGWTMRTSVNIFGGNGWEWNLPSSAWLARHYWEHYAFTGDKEFLGQRAWPIFEDVSRFWLQQLIEKDGKLMVKDGWSPEHGPREDGVAHDQQIIWDLFTNTLEAAAVLGVDDAFVADVRDARARLLGPQVGSWGQIKEWVVERPVLEKSQHRHTSHLFGVYPGRQITLRETPEWANAAILSLAARGNAGDSRRSWTWGWRCALWSRLGMPSQASDMIRGQLTWNSLPNLLACHPPFQIDGNSGITAGICEMLVQSHAGEIALLPAIPIKDKWRSGSFSGLLARGGFVVAAAWENRAMTAASIRSTLGNPATLRLQVEAESLVVTPDGDPPFTVTRRADGTFLVPTKAGNSYRLSW